MLDMRRKCEPYFDSLTKSEMLFKVSLTAVEHEVSADFLYSRCWWLEELSPLAGSPVSYYWR